MIKRYGGYRRMSIAGRVQGRMCQTDSMYHFQPSTWLASEQNSYLVLQADVRKRRDWLGLFRCGKVLEEAHFANACTTILDTVQGEGKLRQSDDSSDEGEEARIDDSQQTENLANEEAASRGL